MDSDALYFTVLREASTLCKQPRYKKDIKAAVNVALNLQGIRKWSVRNRLFSDICSALGHAGGNASVVSRNQLRLFPK